MTLFLGEIRTTSNVSRQSQTVFFVSFTHILDKMVNFFYTILTIWPVRLVVRTSGFHPGNRGSIPLRATKKPQFAVFLYSWQKHIQSATI